MSIYFSKRKHSVIALIMCLLALTISGCSRGNGNYNQVTAVDRISSQTSTSISSEHKLLDGREQYTIHVSDGEELAVRISILNQNGSFSLTIGKSGSTPIYTGNDIESSTFTVYLRESGDYSVIIDANSHEGSYSLNWSIISSASDSETSNSPAQSEVTVLASPEAAVVTVPWLKLVKQAGQQYAETGEIDAALLAEIDSPMIPEETYAKIVNGKV